MTNPNTPRVLAAQRLLQETTTAENAVIATMVAQMLLLREAELPSLEWGRLRLVTGLFEQVAGHTEQAALARAAEDER